MALWRHDHAATHTSTGIVNVEKRVYAITISNARFSNAKRFLEEGYFWQQGK